MRPSIVAALVIGLLLFAPTTSLLAQQRATTDQGELIQTLLNRIEQLERRVSELESSRPALRPPQPEQAVLTPDMIHAESAQTAEGPNLKIAGFSDINFGGSDQPDSKSGFTEGQFILHLNSNLSP